MAIACKKCSERMFCQESRGTKKGTVRRYLCQCGSRAVTLEVEMISQGKGRPLDSVARRALVDASTILEQAVKAIREIKI